MQRDKFTLLRGVQPRGFSAIVYGHAGIGKTTLASNAPGSVVVDIEGGVANIDCTKTPHVENWRQCYDWMKWFHQNNDPSIKTIIFDTIDVLETYIHDDICKREGKASIEKFPFGSGYKMATEVWRQLLRFAKDMNERGVNIIYTAHEQVRRYEDPMNDGYDRYQIKINHNTSNLLIGAVDAVLFAHYQKVLQDNDKETAKKALGTGKRLLQCVETPAVVAKNRYGLKPIEAMDASIWDKMKVVSKEDTTAN